MPEPTQNLSNHAMMDPKFHYFLVPVSALNFLYACYRLIQTPILPMVWFVVMAAAQIVLIFTVRMYSVKIQDRVIRLEERLRLQAILPERLRARIGELSTGQLIALRFASDEEVPALVEAALTQNLKNADIKKQVRTWRADYSRV
jgi:hypothetical protein